MKKKKISFYVCLYICNAKPAGGKMNDPERLLTSALRYSRMQVLLGVFPSIRREEESFTFLASSFIHSTHAYLLYAWLVLHWRRRRFFKDLKQVEKLHKLCYQSTICHLGIEWKRARSCTILILIWLATTKSHFCNRLNMFYSIFWNSQQNMDQPPFFWTKHKEYPAANRYFGGTHSSICNPLVTIERKKSCCCVAQALNIIVIITCCP